MERDSRNVTNNAGSSGAGPSWMDRLDQVAMAQRSSFGGGSPLDLPSAIAREIQRSSRAPAGWQYTWRPPSGSDAQEQAPMGAFVWQDENSNDSGSRLLSQFYIPRFEEAMGPAGSMHHQQTGMQEYSASAEQHGFLSRSSGFHGREDSGMRAAACSPWIEHMTQTDVTQTDVTRADVTQTDVTRADVTQTDVTRADVTQTDVTRADVTQTDVTRADVTQTDVTQADVTQTPCLSLEISAQRAVGDMSCLANATLDMQADLLQRQWSETQSGFHCDSLQRRESTVELSVDLCSDDEDLETHPIDDRRKKRMLSNRASAQRSRQRRQERLHQLEVLTAQLRVENSTLHKKLNSAVQVAKKLEDRNSNLLKRVDKLTKEVTKDVDGGEARKVTPAAIAAAFDESEISQQTTCASSCKLFDGWASMDPTLMREGNVNYDGASSPSMSAGSPAGSRPNESDMDFETSKAEVSPLRESFSACRVGKKRSFGQTEIAGSASFGAPSQPSRLRPSLTGGGFPEASDPLASSFGLDLTSEADRWLKYPECFK